MGKEKKRKIFERILLIGILVVLFLQFVISQTYSTSNFQYNSPSASFLSGQRIELYGTVSRDLCQAGQDFVIQISPTGCTPNVVRSDLLEEQNVPIFCPLMATKINPLIDVQAINYIYFQQRQAPKEVLTIGFHPAKAALSVGSSGLLNSPVMENIG